LRSLESNLALLRNSADASTFFRTIFMYRSHDFIVYSGCVRSECRQNFAKTFLGRKFVSSGKFTAVVGCQQFSLLIQFANLRAAAENASSLRRG
jgi:hypothetical protein